MNTEEKINKVRDELKKAGATAFLCQACDPHESEYISDHYKVTEYLTGFTGENATLLITMDEALLWTDSRFFIQGERELSGTSVKLMKSGEKDVPTVGEYMFEGTGSESESGGPNDKSDGSEAGNKMTGALSCGDKLVVDLSCINSGLRKKLKEECAKKEIAILDDALIADRVWPQRPEVAAHPVQTVEDDIFGGGIEEKLKRLRAAMTRETMEVYQESKLDNLMWLFNLRGSDIPYNTLAFAHGRITMDEAVIYLYDEAVTGAVREHLGAKGVRIRRYDEFVPSYDDQKDLISDLKACKSEKQIEQIRKYFLLDSMAVTEFIQYLEEKLKGDDIENKSVKNGDNGLKVKTCNGSNSGYVNESDDDEIKDELTEKSLAAYLHERRKRIDGFMGESFETISAYGANAALPHYAPSASDEEVRIEKRGFYLCDSGGLYPGVTTDVTRTIACGELTDEERTAYTLVVAGWVKLMNAVWREGCTGLNLDILARQRLWEAGLDYGHGTGHGVGAGLCVHEGPQSISWKVRGEAAVLKPGMLVTCEPGYYKEGPMEGCDRGFGIRIENTLLVVRAEHEGFLKFEPLTLVPIDMSALDRSLLTEEEMRMIDEYQELVHEKLSGVKDYEI